VAIGLLKLPEETIMPPSKSAPIHNVHLVTNDEDAMAEARRRARVAAPDAVAFLVHCIRDDSASNQQRVRSANMVLECAGLLQVMSKPTGLFDSDTGDADGTHAGKPA
jgi:hypothetical protein